MSFIGLRLIFFIVNNSNISLLDNIIDKSYINNYSSIKGITLKEIILYY